MVISKRGTWFKDHCLVFSDPNYPRIQINAMISLTLMIPPPPPKLQGKGIDLTSVPGMVDKRLKDVKVISKRGTWFKDHCLVFSDPNYPRIQINAMISLTLMIPPPPPKASD